MCDVVIKQDIDEQDELRRHIEKKRQLLREQSVYPFELPSMDNLGDPVNVDQEYNTNTTSTTANIQQALTTKPTILQPNEYNNLSGSMNPTTNTTTNTNTTTVVDPALKAPVINALLRISPYERAELEEKLFLKAMKNVKSLMPNEKNNDVLEPLYLKEADRLLKHWIDTH